MAAGGRLKAQLSRQEGPAKVPPPQVLIETSFHEILQHLPDLYTSFVVDKTTLQGFTSTLTAEGKVGVNEENQNRQWILKSKLDSLEGYFKNLKP